MQPQIRSIVVVMALAFSVSVFIMWPQPPAPSPSAGIRRAPPAPPPPQIAADAVAPRPAASPPAPAAVSARANLPRTEAPAAADPDAPELPVLFNIGFRPAFSEAEEAVGSTVPKGIIFNPTDKTFDITVTETVVSTQEVTRAQLVVSRGAQVLFGIDQGLKMASGDEITLRNPSYREITRQVP